MATYQCYFFNVDIMFDKCTNQTHYWQIWFKIDATDLQETHIWAILAKLACLLN